MISYYPLYSVFSNVSTPNILLVTKGHPFDRNAFFEIFDSINVDWTHVEHPAAQVFFDPSHAGDYDAFVMYDMPGVGFGSEGPRFTDPTPEYKQAFLSLLESGQGMGATLTMADEKGAYVLVDGGTWLKRKDSLSLIPIVTEGKNLRNQYAALVVTSKGGPQTNSQLANRFVDFLISAEAQKQIADYRVQGQTLFHPDRLEQEPSE